MRKRRNDDWLLTIIAAALLFILFAYLLAAGTFAINDNPPIRTRKQEALHKAADFLRVAGFAEDSEPIRVLSEEWWHEQERLTILSNVVDGEAGDCPWEHRVAVAVVVLNREADERFPDTVREVVEQTDIINGRVVHQYSPEYVRMNYGARRSSYEAAAAALNGEHEVPEDIVWQAQFPQGTEVWWTSYVDTGWYRSTTYFCR